MQFSRLRLFASVFSFALALPCFAAPRANACVSPAGHVHVTLDFETLQYQVTFDDATILEPSPLGLEFKDQAPLGPMRLVHHDSRRVDRFWHPVLGKASQVRDHYQQESFDLAENSAPFRRLSLQVRCFDDSVAFRYQIPNQPGFENFTITREKTGFRPPDGVAVWASSYKTFRSAYEEEYPRRAFNELPEGKLLGLPALLQISPTTFAAITEADLTDWAGMYLVREGATLTASLSPRLDGDGLVRASAPRNSPWRVILLAHTPAALLESHTIENLNPSSRIADASWINPGIMAWDHWWSGEVEMTNASNERFIDFASFMGFPYQLVDWQWYGPFNKPEADITKAAPQLDMPALLHYAAERNVRLWLWLHSGDVDRARSAGTLDAAFATYRRWGVAGVKIDFMNSDDQDRVRWYEEIVRLAAQHQLMVDFHGAYKPTGLEVTWPNLLTREGVLGNEYNKFSTRDTPTHKATLPFTRGLAGPMDYTPGGFLNTSPAKFRPTTPTQVMGSRANELALFVLYWSPLTCVSDDPAHYVLGGKEAPGLSFLRGLPTVWDETRGLDGEVGKHVIVARRKDKDWWLGGITADDEYMLQLPLRFLGNGRYVAHVYQDPTAPDAPYTEVREETRTVTSADLLSVKMRPAGGIAVHFERIGR
ncbi:glycoside hydrolase family 97 protein [Terriglobus aquaticus]|nr:glycoside hydrolase family 97 protein [Terriglobus aquaticus]